MSRTNRQRFTALVTKAQRPLLLRSLFAAVLFLQRDIEFYRQVMTLAILRGERVPTDEEELLEDGGGAVNMKAWWDVPQEDGQEEDDDDDDDEEEEEEEEDCLLYTSPSPRDS